jgi:hypothetical protein
MHHCPDFLSEELAARKILSSTSTHQSTAFDSSFAAARRQSVPSQPAINISNLNHISQDGFAFRPIPAKIEAPPSIKKFLGSQVNTNTEKKSVNRYHNPTLKKTLIIAQLLRHKFLPCQQPYDGNLPIVLFHTIHLTAAQHTGVETRLHQS